MRAGSGPSAFECGRFGHVFRPGPFSRCRAYWLDGHVLHWRIGADQGHVPLSALASLRVNLPACPGLAAGCVLTEKGGRFHRLSARHWPRWTEAERHAWGRMRRHEATFRNLTHMLARRLARANRAATIETGPSLAEWIATVLLALLSLGVIGGSLALGLAEGRIGVQVAACAGLAAVNLPLLWPTIRTGGPRPIDPESLRPEPAPEPAPAPDDETRAPGR